MLEFIEKFIIYLRSVWRYRWLMLMVAWFVGVLGWGAVVRLPNQYEATATVHADTESILKPLLGKLVVTTNLSERVRQIKMRLFTRPKLKQIARMADLDIEVSSEAEEENLLASLEKKIKISRFKQKDLYKIVYVHENPAIAKKVVSSILTVFIESTLGANRKDTDVAQTFLDQQIEEYKEKLEEAETRLKNFKRDHVGQMPGDHGGYYARMNRAIDELEKHKLVNKELINKKQRLEKLKEEQKQEAIESAKNVAQKIDNELQQGQVHELDAEIEEYKSTLRALKLQFTDEHPDVIQAKSMLQELEEKKKADIAKIKQEKVELITENPLEALKLNPIYQDLLISLGQTEANLAVSKARLAEYQIRVDKLRAKIDVLPAVEAELKSLNRDYMIHKKNYEALVDRKESALISQNVEQRTDNVNFDVIDPPFVSSKPSGPPRVLYSVVVMVFSIACGIFFAFFMGQIKPVIDSHKSLEKVAGRPVLGAVSLIVDAKRKVRRRLEVISFSIGFICYFGFFILVVGIHYAGIDLVAKISQMVG
ncbi:MAG: hypothetical protein D6B28_11505 [Gammaproteobacteria bacterium]|nr:MAG: hypothetical protein D6B28_11505 [Gammaproteobacteria bacterium]